MLPAIDRWGYVEQYSSMQRTSLSAMLPDLVRLLDVSGPAVQIAEPEPRPPVRHFTQEEQEAVLARADKLNARINALLAEHD